MIEIQGRVPAAVDQFGFASDRVGPYDFAASGDRMSEKLGDLLVWFI